MDMPAPPIRLLRQQPAPRLRRGDAGRTRRREFVVGEEGLSRAQPSAVCQRPIRRLTLREPQGYLEGVMGRLFRFSIAAAALGAVALPAVHPAEAKTCSDRLTVCQKFCIRSESGSPACMAACSGYLQACLASGCWESKYFEKDCGFTRR